MGYTAVRRGDPAIESFQGRFFKMRRALGATGVGLNEVRFEAGQSGPAQCDDGKHRVVFRLSSLRHLREQQRHLHRKELQPVWQR